MPQAHVCVDLETGQNPCSFPENRLPLQLTPWGRGTTLGGRPSAERGVFQRKGSRTTSDGSRAREGVTRGALFTVPPWGARLSHTARGGRVRLQAAHAHLAGREHHPPPHPRLKTPGAPRPGRVQVCTAAYLLSSGRLFSRSSLSICWHQPSMRSRSACRSFRNQWPSRWHTDL